jgi:hypothetical protein
VLRRGTFGENHETSERFGVAGTQHDDTFCCLRNRLTDDGAGGVSRTTGCELGRAVRKLTTDVDSLVVGNEGEDEPVKGLCERHQHVGSGVANEGCQHRRLRRPKEHAQQILTTC